MRDGTGQLDSASNFDVTSLAVNIFAPFGAVPHKRPVLGKLMCECDRRLVGCPRVPGRRCTRTALAPGVAQSLSLSGTRVHDITPRSAWSSTSLPLALIRTVWNKVTHATFLGGATSVLCAVGTAHITKTTRADSMP